MSQLLALKLYGIYLGTLIYERVHLYARKLIRDSVLKRFYMQKKKNEREAETVTALRHTTVSDFHYQCASHRTFLIQDREFLSNYVFMISHFE